MRGLAVPGAVHGPEPRSGPLWGWWVQKMDKVLETEDWSLDGAGWGGGVVRWNVQPREIVYLIASSGHCQGLSPWGLTLMHVAMAQPQP